MIVKRLSSSQKIACLATQVRKDCIRMITKAGSGHPAGSLGMADVFATLYGGVLNHNPKRPQDPNRDRVILSNGHICPVWYATLAHTGYFPQDQLLSLRSFGSPLQGHPHAKVTQVLAGVENTSGPLGQGVSFACGVALAAKMNKKNHRVFAFLSDGECEEGQTWEAFLFAHKYALDNLTFIIDRNTIQISGHTKNVMPLEPLAQKLESFGLHVLEVDGHDIGALKKNLKKRVKGRPVVVLCHTVPGKGVSFMENKPVWHGKAPSQQEARKALDELSKAQDSLRGDR